MKKFEECSDAQVIELYEKYESCKAVADCVGTTAETVRRILIRNDIPRTHRHEQEKTYRQWRHKYCHAIVGILYNVCGMDECEIEEASGIPNNAIRQILSRKYGVTYRKCNRVYKKDVDMDAIECEYLSGVSTYEIGRKYNVPHATISKWMNQKGYVRGKFTGINTFTYNHECVECGRIFSSKAPNARYCSRRCHNSATYRRRHSTSHKVRAEKYGVEYDSTITLKKLYKRDGGICQICGELCDWDDTTWGLIGPNHPSIDHIVPFAKGGAHTWDNVQLAHHMCNSLKQDKLEVAV